MNLATSVKATGNPGRNGDVTVAGFFSARFHDHQKYQFRALLRFGLRSFPMVTSPSTGNLVEEFTAATPSHSSPLSTT